MKRLSRARHLLKDKDFTPNVVRNMGIEVNLDGTRRSGYQLLSFPGVTFETIQGLDESFAEIDRESAVQVSREALYANYLDRQQRDVDLLKKDEAIRIPAGFDYAALGGLSNELKGKLGRTRPETVAQAARIDGMTPAALALIVARLRQDQRRASA